MLVKFRVEVIEEIDDQNQSKDAVTVDVDCDQVITLHDNSVTVCNKSLFSNDTFGDEIIISHVCAELIVNINTGNWTCDLSLAIMYSPIFCSAR